MGAFQSSPPDFAGLAERLEPRCGRLPVSGRFHRPPRRIEDDYDVWDRVLGAGYNGVVRKASSKRTKEKQRYAVKAFKLTSIPRDKREQLEAEVEIFLSMDHPHVTRLYDVYEHSDLLYLVMECCEGGELFDRVSEFKHFSERDAADAMWQMLLAISYLHSHGIVHRDIKLENFLYDKRGGTHLKLIDFGFSKVWDPNIKMKMSCGTLGYVAPEVLERSYTSQCDMWSLGVISFILLSGVMPFYGSQEQQMQNIVKGRYHMRPKRWGSVSENAKDFVQSLLKVDPLQRLTTETALAHPWIAERHAAGNDAVDVEIVDALRQFGQASKFRRCCMEMMAWSLSNDERAQVQQYFVSMDRDSSGTITMQELRQVLQEKFHVPEDETKAVFEALDSNHDEEIHYSDFLAAMVSTRIALHDDLLRVAFMRFDTDKSGYITSENLREVLGDVYDGEQVDAFVAEADAYKDGRISYSEFVSYLRGDALEPHHAEATVRLIDAELSRYLHSDLLGLAARAGIPLLRRKFLSRRPSPPLVGKLPYHAPACCALM